ncbi:hypothetical protein [Psychroserpens burtonensis]|uniref:hypothetical protein n=1 Tax=Psychroserpens burtonensis TaxID=49278 RepID=UPI00048C3201|nr:hypothetical protein [Psychroserpens burtonensis]
MKKITLTLLFLISINIYSQEQQKIFKPEFEKFVIQCETIGRTIINKNVATELSSWYEGSDIEKVNSNINQLESDIDNSVLDATYYLVMMNENPLIYSFHFYNEETKTEFGQLFIQFMDRENNLVDNIRFASKTEMKKVSEESKIYPGNMKIPPPSPPQTKKKKNRN